MSIQKKVSIKRAVQQGMDNIGLETNDMVPAMTVWAAEAESRIGSFTQYQRKIYNLTVSGCKTELPCEVVAVLGVLIGNYGCECSLQFQEVYGVAFSQRLSSTQGFLVIDGATVAPSSRASWRIVDNNLVFNNHTEGEITIEALVQEVDQEGFPLISEGHVYAIASFLEWMFMKRSRHRVSGVNYSRTEVADQFMLWSRLAANAHANDNKLTPEQERTIAAIYNDPLSGVANATWLYKNSYYGAPSVL